jgi:hypothetical protein
VTVAFPLANVPSCCRTKLPARPHRRPRRRSRPTKLAVASGRYIGQHLRLDQRKIDAAKRLLRAKTERETIERALDLVLAEAPILRAHARVKAVGGFVDVFGG